MYQYMKVKENRNEINMEIRDGYVYSYLLRPT